MEQSIITKGRYTYLHDVSKRLSESVDVHHITIRRSLAGGIVFSAFALFAITCFLLLWQDISLNYVLWSFSSAVFLFRMVFRNQVERESVVIFPGFGVQLETLYMNGKTVCRFVPTGKILKPVLNECLTPVTCYWSLSLIIREQEELLLVFKEFCPPVSMLVPIWKALCAATANVHSYCDTTKSTENK